jgi:hypothetical protein
VEGTRTPTLDDVQRAIDKDDRREALIRSDLVMSSGRYFMNSAFWMQRAYVMLMNGDTDEAKHCVVQAQGLNGYEASAYEPFLRTLVRYYIRRRDSKSALQILDEFEGWYTEAAQLFWLHAMRGESYFAEASRTLAPRGSKQQRRIRAAEEFAAAEKIWQRMDSGDQARWEELRKTIRLQWFLVLAETDTIRHESKLQELFQQIMESETNAWRRFKMYFAKPSVTIGWLLHRPSSEKTG